MKGYLIDRWTPRNRPAGTPIMRQNWEDFLFLHWPIDPTLVRPLVPDAFEIDVYDSHGWISLTPFCVTGLHIRSAPEIPGLTDFAELNFRTYVHYQGVPGVWFFSLDASRILPVLGAHIFFDLPYHNATIEMHKENGDCTFSTRRGADGTEFSAAWRSGRLLAAPDVDSLAYFLTERYCVYAGKGENITRTQIHHTPWTLSEGDVSFFRSNIFSTYNLPRPTSNPIAYASHQFGVEFWPPMPLLAG